VGFTAIWSNFFKQADDNDHRPMDIWRLAEHDREAKVQQTSLLLDKL
jgi:hypothetical protein